MPALRAASSAAMLVDISAVMSTTRRACISLRGHVVHVAHTLSSTQVHSTVSIHKLQPGALLAADVRTASKPAVAAVCDALRQRADRLLCVHAEHSTPAAADEPMQVNDEEMEPAFADIEAPCAAMEPCSASSAPLSASQHSTHLQFKCSADGMPCRALQEACTAPTASQPCQQSAVDNAVALKGSMQALGDTLGLAQRLFCALEPADGSQGAGGHAGEVQLLLAAQRKREVAAWLEEQVEPEVNAAIQEVCSSEYR